MLCLRPRLLRRALLLRYVFVLASFAARYGYVTVTPAPPCPGVHSPIYVPSYTHFSLYDPRLCLRLLRRAMRRRLRQ